MKTKITVLLSCGMLASLLAPAAESVAQARQAQSLVVRLGVSAPFNSDAATAQTPQAQVTNPCDALAPAADYDADLAGDLAERITVGVLFSIATHF